MTAFFSAVFGAFLSPAGLFALAALDSSMVFFLPAAVDMAVVILAARYHDMFWAFPPIATAGSVVGSYITFRIGSKIGENSLECWIPERRLKSIQGKIKDKGAIALGLTALIPPPFPLTPFVLACGAFKVRRATFFTALAVARFLRFSVMALLALIYGRRIIALLDSPIFKAIITCFIIIAVAGTVYSGYRLVRSTRTSRLKGAHRGAA
jgi:membrane protein YqaA with SNARE-associated domain